MRRLRAEEKRLEEELHNLGGTSSPAEPAAGERAVLVGPV